MTTTPSVDPNLMFLGGAILGVGSVFLAVIFISIYVLSSLMIVANAMIFVKAGRPSWASIIPFYNSYLLFDFAMGMGWLGLVLAILPIISIFLSSTISIIFLLIEFIIYIFLNIKLANRFGKGIWFAVGLIFLPFIFYPILAFGNANYEAN